MKSPSRLLVVLLLLGAAVAVARRHVYRGPTAEPARWDGRVDRDAVVSEARKLKGVWYDPVQGGFGDVGGRAGLIVCMDVPVIAYRNAGASIRRLLEADYAAHPGTYGPHDGAPGDPYFHRRARNLFTYAKNNGRLDLRGPPRPGDVVFLSRTARGAIEHIALVSHVEPDGNYFIVESSRDYFYTTREVEGADLARRRWVFRGFGRLLGETAPRAELSPKKS